MYLPFNTYSKAQQQNLRLLCIMCLKNNNYLKNMLKILRKTNEPTPYNLILQHNLI